MDRPAEPAAPPAPGAQDEQALPADASSGATTLDALLSGSPPDGEAEHQRDPSAELRPGGPGDDREGRHGAVDRADEVQQGRLAAAGRPDNRQNFSLSNPQIDFT